MSVPSDARKLSASGHLQSTAIADPDNVVDPTSESHPPVVADIQVAPPAIQPGILESGWAGFAGYAAVAEAVSSLACSGHAPFGHIRGSMTCEVSLHPADFQGVAYTLPAGAQVALFDVDGLEFNTLVTDHDRFKCSGSTINRTAFSPGFDEVDNPNVHPVLKLACETLTPLVFTPGESVRVVTFSVRVLTVQDSTGLPFHVDWTFCPIAPFEDGGKSYDLCIFAGGSAGD
jgi:hypothetical protein